MLSSEALNILSVCESDSTAQTVTIPKSVGQLDRGLYEQVDDVLTRLGGKWVRKSKVHQFPYDPAPLLAAVLESKELPPKNPTAFFPTPAPVIDRMLEALDMAWRAEARILEPSAGTGAICKALKHMACENKNDWQIECCEVLPINRAALTSSGFKLVADDFMAYKPKFKYDVIVMNPPFSVDGHKDCYVDHVYHAWQMLSDRGCLAAIVPPGWLYGGTSKMRNFREFVCDTFEIEEIGAGAFKDSGTGVNTYLIYAHKHDEKWRTQEYNGWVSHHAWSASLWMDNDRECYEAAHRAANRSQFESVAQDAVRKLLKQSIPLVLREKDIDELWTYYHQE